MYNLLNMYKHVYIMYNIQIHSHTHVKLPQVFQYNWAGDLIDSSHYWNL